MKVAIFETEHFEGAFPVIRLFDLPGNEITIYTSADAHRQFMQLFGDKMDRFNWVVLPNSSRKAFFSAFKKGLRANRPDLLYLNTVSNNHLLFAIILLTIKIPRIVLTVHDINCLFVSKMRSGFRNIIIHTGKKWLIKRITNFNVVAETLVEYLRSKTAKPISVIPGAVYEQRAIASNSLSHSLSHSHFPSFPPLRLVVPGSIDNRRRDYNRVFELGEKLNAAGISSEITLLGGHNDDYGKEIISRASTFLHGTCRIKYYDSKIVEQEEFDRRMDDCHLVFIPSVVNTKICGDIPEIYGITKSSGNIFDVIKHAKPFIVPATLVIAPNLSSSCFKYRSIDEVVSFLRQLVMANGLYTDLAKKAEQNSQHYTMERVRERNKVLFDRSTS